jgi:NADPH-dependent curcumin reductase CurA
VNFAAKTRSSEKPGADAGHNETLIERASGSTDRAGADAIHTESVSLFTTEIHLARPKPLTAIADHGTRPARARRRTLAANAGVGDPHYWRANNHDPDTQTAAVDPVGQKRGGIALNATLNHQVVLAEAPSGKLGVHHFKSVTTEVEPLDPDQVLIRVIYAQVPPAARAVMTNTTAFPMTRPGEGIFTAVVGEVIDGPAAGPSAGTLVTCFAGWEEYSIVPVSQVRPVPAAHPLHRHLGVLGHNGLAAYFGMLKVGHVQPDDTVVVSAAAGGVGHLAGQLARIAGARVIGITGSDDKNRRLEEDLGFSATVNRRSPTFATDLRGACADGAGVFFDNVGGDTLDAMLPLMAARGRVVCCGAVASYDTAQDGVLAPGPRGIPLLIINKALRIEGFLTADFMPEWGEALDRLAKWTQEGHLRPITKVWEGLDAAPEALVAMLAGENVGQVVVRVGPDPT